MSKLKFDQKKTTQNNKRLAHSRISKKSAAAYKELYLDEIVISDLLTTALVVLFKKMSLSLWSGLSHMQSLHCKFLLKVLSDQFSES